MITVKNVMLTRSVWANIIGGAIQIGGYFAGMIPAEWQPVFAGGMVLLNILMRRITDTPATFTEGIK